MMMAAWINRDSTAEEKVTGRALNVGVEYAVEENRNVWPVWVDPSAPERM
jgi:hypothetical protein